MKKKYIIIVLLFIINIGVLCSGKAYSAYKSKTTSKSDLSIAKIYFNNKENNTISLPINNIIPGNGISYDFYVSNSKDNNKSDVDIAYNIIIETYFLIPVKINLYSIDNIEKLILSCDSTLARNSENKIECKSDEFVLNYKNNEINNYKIRIDFPLIDSDGNNWKEEYANSIDFIDIKLDSRQKTN